MSKKKRVLHISPNSLDSHCGVAKYASFLANSLKFRYDVKFLTEKSSKKSKHVFNIKSWKLNEFFNYIKIIKNYKPDIIHIHLTDGLLNKGLLITFIPLISIIYSKKIVQTWHEPCGNKNFLKFFLLTFNNFKIISPRPDFIELVEKYMFFIFRFHFYFKKINYIESSYVSNKINININETYKIKKKLLINKKRLIVTFGHAYPNKRFETVFKLINLKSDKLIIVSKLDENKSYGSTIIKLIDKFKNNCEIIQDLSDRKLFKLLVVADVIVLPFFPHPGSWSTSLSLSKLSRSFIITTSNEQKGYNKKENIFYFDKFNIKNLKKSIVNYSGKKNNLKLNINSWSNISKEHVKIYSN